MEDGELEGGERAGGGEVTKDDDYDEAARRLLRRHFKALLPWLLGLSGKQCRVVRLLDPQLDDPGQSGRVSDSVAWVVDKSRHGEPWAIVVEFQSRPDPDILGRSLEYEGSSFRFFRPSEEKGDRFHVGTVLVHLTGTVKGLRTMAWPEAGIQTGIEGPEWHLEAKDANEFLDGIEAGTIPAAVLVWIPLMNHGGEDGIIERAMRIADGITDRLVRADIPMAGIFAGLTEHATKW